MQVSVVELGSPSKVTTNARRFAPQGAIILGQILERMTFADEGAVILDWDDSLDVQPEGAVMPVIFVRTAKRTQFANMPYVKVEVRLDIEDLFGNDNVTAENLLEVIVAMEREMLNTIEKREKNL